MPDPQRLVLFNTLGRHLVAVQPLNPPQVFHREEATFRDIGTPAAGISLCIPINS